MHESVKRLKEILLNGTRNYLWQKNRAKMWNVIIFYFSSGSALKDDRYDGAASRDPGGPDMDGDVPVTF